MVFDEENTSAGIFSHTRHQPKNDQSTLTQTINLANGFAGATALGLELGGIRQ